MKLCITEKPSVAADIAKIFGNGPRRDGYYDCGEWKITWTFGHLCCLKEPHDYTELWKRWSLGQLPMIPAKFGIKLIDIDNYKRQFDVIKKLAAEATEVINCGDAGQEGELIQRWVMQMAGVKCPVKRLWISSLTDESIREGFANLQPESKFQNLYLAGLSRAIGDWLLGMNATRLYSLKYSAPGNVLSIGRVQTPTLALVVKRHKEINEFTPEDYWELKTLYRGVTFNAVKGRFNSEAQGQEAIEKISTAPLTITSVEQKNGREAPPRLFDLTSLQVEANKRWGWSADDTLRLIQSLYEKKVTTYPRVDTTYLTDDVYPKVPGILKNLTPYASLTAPLLGTRLPKTKKVFDNSKVTDHHAIIPTGAPLGALVGDEKKLFHLIAMRFIAAFYPDCKFNQTQVEAKVTDILFKATGKVITDLGWKALFAQDKSDDNDDDKTLPQFAVGESGPHEPSLIKKTTQPPKYYDEGTLLKAMEAAGKTVDDEELREALKANGIGRPSTRASIIETLVKRRYIYRKGKTIMASQAGIDLIGLIQEDLLKSAKLTGIWENKLRRIESGDYNSAEFIDELKVMVRDVVISVLSDNSNRRILLEEAVPEPAKKPKKAKDPNKPKAPRVTKIEQILCPACGEGHLLKGRTAYGCSRYAEGCKMMLPFTDYPDTLTPGQLNKMVKKLTK